MYTAALLALGLLIGGVSLLLSPSQKATMPGVAATDARSVAEAFNAYRSAVNSLAGNTLSCVGPSPPSSTWTFTGNSCGSSYNLTTYLPTANTAIGSPFNSMGNYQNKTTVFEWYAPPTTNSLISANQVGSFVLTATGTNTGATVNIGIKTAAGTIAPINTNAGSNVVAGTPPVPPAGIPVGALVAWQGAIQPAAPAIYSASPSSGASGLTYTTSTSAYDGTTQNVCTGGYTSSQVCTTYNSCHVCTAYKTVQTCNGWTTYYQWAVTACTYGPGGSSCSVTSTFWNTVQ